MNQSGLKKETVCIVLLNYFNNGDTIDCVRSILGSDLNEKPYIVVVDNSEVISSLEENLGFYPRIKYLFPGKNLGFAEGNNFGIRWALENVSFEYLFILNNDTVLESRALRMLISAAYENSDVKLFTPCIITSDSPPRIWYAGGKMNLFKMTPVINDIGKPFKKELLQNNFTGFASGCAMFFNAKCNFNFNVLFDPFFFMYDEDVELSLRWKEGNEKILFVSDAIIFHKCQGSQKKGRNVMLNQLSPGHTNIIFYLRNTIRNRLYIIEKHFKGMKKLSLISFVTGYWLLKSLQFSVHFNFRSALVIYQEILKYFSDRIKVNR